MLIVPVFLVLGLVIFYPLAMNLRLSLSDADLLRLRQAPQFVGLANYVKTLSDPVFWASLATTLIITVSAVFIQIVLGTATALLIDRQPRRFQFFLASILFLPYVLPTVAIAMMWKWMLNETYGIVNQVFLTSGIIEQPISWLGNPSLAVLSVILIEVWARFPFVMVIVLASLTSIPEQLYEAAKLDGASWRQLILHITLPWLKFVLIIVASIRFLWTFNHLELIWVLTKGGPSKATTTLPILVFTRGFLGYDLSRAAALSFIMLVILMSIVMPRIQKANVV